MKNVSHPIVVGASDFSQKADIASALFRLLAEVSRFERSGSDLVRREPGGSSWYLQLSLCFFIFLFALPLPANAATDYVLTNGLITLSARPPEGLTGTFALADEVILNSPHGDVRYYEFLALEFQSVSASFALSAGSLTYVPNSEGPPTVYFTARVRATGLPLETVLLRSSGAGDAFQSISILDTNETQQLGTMSFSALAVPKPRLSISRADGTTIRIAWATNFMDYRLEVATSLTAAMWETVTNSVATEGGQVKVNLLTDGAQRWYRLHKP